MGRHHPAADRPGARGAGSVRPVRDAAAPRQRGPAVDPGPGRGRRSRPRPGSPEPGERDSASAGGVAVERLLHHLVDGEPGHPLSGELSAWLAGSARFRAFAEAHRDKIRRKLRGATDADAQRDVRAELRVAHLLLADRRFGLAFEAYGTGKAGPDFTVTFRVEHHFNLEVTRLRRVPDTTSIAGAVVAKLRQLPPGVPNALLLSTEGHDAGAIDVGAAIRALRARADAKDEAFFEGRGFGGTRGFYERFLRLGAVVVWCESAAGDARATLWANPSARIALPARAGAACVACLRGG